MPQNQLFPKSYFPDAGPSRYLDPLAGTFLSRDPIGIWGDPGNLGNGNAYAGNNPWSMVDPFGLQFEMALYGPMTGSQIENFGPSVMSGIADAHNTLIAEPVRRWDPHPGPVSAALENEYLFVDRTQDVDLVSNGNNAIYTGTQLLANFVPIGVLTRPFRAGEGILGLGRAARGAAEEGALCKVLREAAPVKPPLPEPVAPLRYTWPGHETAVLPEEELARIVHALPDEVVIRWGDKIGAHGSDVISVNIRTGEVTLWDGKYRSANVRITSSSTFRENSNPLANALRQAESAITNNTSLPPGIRDTALSNVRSGNVTTRTAGIGNARNSTLR